MILDIYRMSNSSHVPNYDVLSEPRLRTQRGAENHNRSGLVHPSLKNDGRDRHMQGVVMRQNDILVDESNHDQDLKPKFYFEEIAYMYTHLYGELIIELYLKY